MDHLPLISTIAVGFVAAWLCGLVTQRLGLSPIVGYLLAGVALGPSTPGFVADAEIAHQLAEVGVILLMFGVGLHFDLKDLMAVKGVAIPGALVQSVVATLLGYAAFTWLGMPASSAVVVGMALAVASTVVLMRVLMDADILDSHQGHVAVGWLLVEDVLTVIVLVILPVMGGTSGPLSEESAAAAGPNVWFDIGLALVKLVVLVATVLVFGNRVVPWVMVQVARLRSRELFTLTVLVFSISLAAATYVIFGASMALGAFLAGMMVAQSPVSHQAAADALPLRDAFAVLFFVSVGMLFDPLFLVQEPLLIVVALAIILIAKPLAALAVVAVLGHSVRTALTVALGLAQIGEFSFILSELYRRQMMVPGTTESEFDKGHSVLVAAAIISITINPLLFRAAPAIEAWLRRRPRLWRLLNGRAERLASDLNETTEIKLKDMPGREERLAIIVGYGPVGRVVQRLLTDAGLTTVVIDMNLDTITELKSRGLLAIYGDASHVSILEQAGMKRASHLVLTLPQAATRLAIITAAKLLNEKARVFVRAHYLREREDLERVGATAAVFEEAEAAVALARLVLAETGAQRDVVEQKVRDIRLALIQENMSKIRTQRVGSIMVPWTRVHRLANHASRAEVLRTVSEQRFSRWPVTDAQSGKVLGYLLTKDLIAEAANDAAWTRHLRPLHTLRPETDVESALLEMQTTGASMCVVEDSGAPLGIVTMEDVLEQVVGRIEDEYPHEAKLSLREAVAAGGVVLDVTATTMEDAIGQLAAAIPSERLPAAARIAELAVDRELEISTDLGVGVAIPHARCPSLASPLVVVGRAPAGIESAALTAEPVRLLFLLVTPLEQPDVQLALLAQLARLAGNASVRERLLNAESEQEVLAIVGEPGAT